MGIKKTALAAVAASALAVASVGGALAGTIATSTGITAGALTLSAPGTASLSATLTGADQVATGSLGKSTVKDATGSGAGWNVTISGSQFTTGGGSPHTLPTGALDVTAVAVNTVAGRAPTNSIGYSTAIAVPLGSAPTPVKIYNAAANSGMGTVELTPALSLDVAADTYAGTYSSNLVVSVVAGP
jgi:putative surface cell wall-binding protein